MKMKEAIAATWNKKQKADTKANHERLTLANFSPQNYKKQSQETHAISLMIGYKQKHLPFLAQLFLCYSFFLPTPSFLLTLLEVSQNICLMCLPYSGKLILFHILYTIGSLNPHYTQKRWQIHPNYLPCGLLLTNRIWQT